MTVTDSVRGHLQPVFEKSQAPANDHDAPERGAGKLKMSVPCESHKNVRGEQEEYG